MFLFGEATCFIEGFCPSHHGVRNGLHVLPLPDVQRTYLFILRSSWQEHNHSKVEVC